jgi:hypothetical protein
MLTREMDGILLVDDVPRMSHGRAPETPTHALSGLFFCFAID